MKDEDIVAAFNEWLRRYTENPDNYVPLSGCNTTYGHDCLAYLKLLCGELTQVKV